MKTLPKFYCFVLMPFSEAFDDIYQLGIKAACEAAGAYSERVDEQIFQGSILERVFNQIARADLIIADMTNRNPNVFYEVGYAHALGKRTILLTNNSDDIPFDLKHFPHIIYNNKISYLKDELIKKVSWYIDNPQDSHALTKVNFDIYLGKINILQEKVVYVTTDNRLPSPKFTIYNPTSFTFDPGSLKIGVLSSDRYKNCQSREIESIELPDNKILHLLPYLDVFLPNAYLSFNFILNKVPVHNVNEELTIRIFTEMGKMDYPFYLSLDVAASDPYIKILDTHDLLDITNP